MSTECLKSEIFWSNLLVVVAVIFFYWVLEHNWDIIVWFLQQFLLLASSLYFTLWPWLVSFPVKKGHSLANRPRYKLSKENKKKNNTLNSLFIPDLLSYRGAIQGLWGPCSFIITKRKIFFFLWTSQSLVTSGQACSNGLASPRNPEATNTSDGCHMDNNYPYTTCNQRWEAGGGT